MKRIESLTAAQQARFAEFVDKWTRIGLSTAPADRPRAEAGVRRAYEIAGLPAPQRIVWCGSPMSQGLTRAIVFELSESSVWDSVRNSVWDSVRDSVRDSIWDSVWASVWASVRNSVWASVRNSVWASVRNSVWDSVRNSVWASVWDSVWASVGASVWASVGASVGDSVGASVGDSVRNSVWASVRDSVGASVGDSVGASVGDSVYGQHDANWLAFYDYFASACGLSEQTQKLAGLWEVSQSANWWLPHRNVCWISERHNILNRDDRGRLHCTDGPALAYPDGWSIHAIGGVRVPEQVVMTPDKQTVDQIRGEQNAEIKRIRIERFAGRGTEAVYGWQKYMQKVGAKILDRRDNDVEGTKELLMRTDSETVLVCHCPSTARVYAMEVPNDVEKAEQAQRYLWSGSRTAELLRRPMNIIGRT